MHDQILASSNEARDVEVKTVVHMSDASFRWPGSNAFTLAIDDFRVDTHGHVLIVGASGGGKSTLLSLLTGIIAPQSGAIRVLGEDITRLSSFARDRFRAEHFGIIFQMFNLLPYGSVIDNVVLPLRFSRARRARAQARGSASEEAARILAGLGLDDSVIHEQSASRLSVGQQQRVAAARALIGSPEIIVADEPTSSLDRNRQIAFLDLLFDDLDRSGSTLIMVSHDESLASRFRRVIRLDDIAVVTRGTRS